MKNRPLEVYKAYDAEWHACWALIPPPAKGVVLVDVQRALTQSVARMHVAKEAVRNTEKKPDERIELLIARLAGAADASMSMYTILEEAKKKAGELNDSDMPLH